MIIKLEIEVKIEETGISTRSRVTIDKPLEVSRGPVTKDDVMDAVYHEVDRFEEGLDVEARPKGMN